MNVNVEMTPVSTCKVVECAYNRNEQCNARGITVGDSDNPKCDTFFTSDRHASGMPNAGVGACKVSVCEYNDGFQCAAESIEIATSRDRADCVTYERRESSIFV